MPAENTDVITVAKTTIILHFLGRKGSISPSAVPVNEPGVTPDIIQSAIDSLTVAGVIHRDPDGDLRASAALVELDALRMSCV
jgi:hypothetical protein